MIRQGLPQAPESIRRYAAPVEAGPCPDIGSCLASGVLLLKRAGIKTARLDAECLLAHVLGSARWQVLLEPGRRLAQAAVGRYLELLRRRRQREPLAYLVGTREFWSLTLSVSPEVLIPRPETETLVEAALALLREAHPAHPHPIIVDLCTGSGAIAIALAREIPNAHIFATDLSQAALRVARMNAVAHGVVDRITFLQGDVWQAMTGQPPADGVDLVVANPPYIPTAALAILMPEVQWEPREALDGGPDGLRVLGEIIGATPQHLRPGGVLLLEIGADLAIAVTALFQGAARYEPPQVLQDLAGRDRVIIARTRADAI
jgi:release factor glutamine methyltransferase